jgi:hypothetical protein
MSFADTFGFAPELPNQWQVPGKPLIVAIEPRFARRLEHASASASPRSGGLLLGQVHSGDTERVILTDCVPLQWDRSQGGAPFLTAVQREQMEEALHESSNEGGPQIVGWYRSASPDEGALSQDDTAIWEQYFRRSSDIAILAGYHSSSFRALVFVTPTASIPGRRANHDAACVSIPALVASGSGTSRDCTSGFGEPPMGSGDQRGCG